MRYMASRVAVARLRRPSNNCKLRSNHAFLICANWLIVLTLRKEIVESCKLKGILHTQITYRGKLAGACVRMCVKLTIVVLPVSVYDILVRQQRHCQPSTCVIRGRVVKGVGHLDHGWSYGVREVVSSIPDRQYSRMSFSSDQVTGEVFSSEHAFPSKFWIYLEHCPRGEAVITGHLSLSSMR